MHFKRISISGRNGGKVRIEYTDGITDQMISSVEAARPEFYDAIKAMATDAIALCEFPADWKPSIHTQGILFKHQDDKTHVSIVGARKLKDGKTLFRFVSPAKLEEKLSKAARDRIATLTGEANLYLAGERAQTKMFDKADKSTPMFPKNTEVNTETGEIREADGDDTKITIQAEGGEPVSTTLGGLKRVTDGLKDGTVRVPRQTKNQRRNQKIMDRNRAKRAQANA